jgi:hypothetical protein
MAVDKDFVIRNGIQVNENLIYADADSDKIGIGTTTPDKKLVIIGDTEVSKRLAVGTTITAQRLVTTGVSTSNIGLEVGVGGTVFTSSTLTKKIGINSDIPAYTLDVIGPVSIGQTAEYVYGDLTVTGNIKATSLAGQISAGGTVGFTNVTVEKNLISNDAEIFTKFTLEEVNSDTFRFLTAGDPPGIGFTQNTDDPELYLLRGKKYEFHVDSGGFPFYIKTAPTADLNNIYNNGVDGNGTQVGILTIRVPFDAPNRLFYQASNVAGMGATIYLQNNGKQIDVGVATVRNRLDSDGYADFENIYVSGIGTINNIKSNNYSVSAGIVTVRQDQTAFIGVSTGADRVSVQTTSSSATHQVSFVNNVGLGSNYPLHLIDSDVNQLTYVPSTNVLSCTRFVGNVSGIATGADNINVDKINTNTDYQVIFSEQGATDYKRMYIDTDSSHLTYNPSTETLTVENIIGNLFGIATNANFINVDTNTQNTNHQVLFSANQGGGFQRPYIDSQSNELTYNPSTNTFSVSNLVGDLVGDVTGNLTGIALNADFINIDEINSNTNYQLLFSTNQAAGYQRPYIDSDSNQLTYNPSTRTFSVQNISASTVTGVTFTGTSNQADFINVDETGSNVDYQVLFSTNQAAGYQRPYIDSGSGQFIYNPSTNRLTVGNFTGNGAGLTNLAGDKITTGVINVNRLPDASTSAQGVSKLNNSITGTSQIEAASSKAVGDLKSHANNASNLSAGTVPAARLPSATNSIQGAVIVNNTYPPTGTSTVQPPSVDAFRRLYDAVGNLIPSGSKMLFYQASAPAGWTKLTADNNKTLRVVSGSGGGSGGTNSFTSAFSERGVPLTAHNHNGNISDQSNNHTHSGSTGNQSANHTHGGNTGNANSNHNHPMNYGGANGEFVTRVDKQRAGYQEGGREAVDDIGVYRGSVTYTPQSTRDAGADHSHSFNTGNNSSNHSHSFNTGGISANHTHNLDIDPAGSSSANMDFRVQYIDVIVCKKD